VQQRAKRREIRDERRRLPSGARGEWGCEERLDNAAPTARDRGPQAVGGKFERLPFVSEQRAPIGEMLALVALRRRGGASAVPERERGRPDAGSPGPP